MPSTPPSSRKAAFAPEARTWAGHGKWSTLFGDYSNEVLAGYAVTNEPRSTASDAPAIFVTNVGAAGTRLIAGADPSSQLLTLRQRDAELTDNLTRSFGNHTVTVGAQAELMHFTFGNFSNATGQYVFFDLDSLAAGRPSRFMRNLALEPGADFLALRPRQPSGPRCPLTRRHRLADQGVRDRLPRALHLPSDLA